MIAGVAGLILGFAQQRMWARRAGRTEALEEREEARQPPHY
jgi:hypothetical protein